MGLRQKALVLDRDGVINEPVVREGKPYPPASLEEFRILPGVSEAWPWYFRPPRCKPALCT